MGDPFSATGSAAGIVSLALQVFQGLARYISKYRSSDKEIKNIKSKTDGLKTILETLSVTLQDAEALGTPSFSAIFQSALHTIEGCGKSIKELKDMLEQVKSSPSPSTFQKLKETMNRALYALRRDSPGDLLNTVNGLQDNLNTALHHLQLSVISTLLSSLESD